MLSYQKWQKGTLGSTFRSETPLGGNLSAFSVCPEHHGDISFVFIFDKQTEDRKDSGFVLLESDLDP